MTSVTSAWRHEVAGMVREIRCDGGEEDLSVEGYINGGGGEEAEELVKQLHTELLFRGPGGMEGYWLSNDH